MQEFLEKRRWRTVALGTLGAVALLIVIVLTVLLLAENRLRGPVIRYASAQSGRQINVGGRFEAHVFSWHPWLIAEQVVIGNPPWMPPGITAEIGRLTLTFDLPFRGGSFGLRSLAMERATLYLARDARARSNWQVLPPDAISTGPPLIRSLRLPGMRVYLKDERRHLDFDGIVSAQDAPASRTPAALRIDGVGLLNGRAAVFALHGDPLATVTRAQPYHFEFTETSGGARLSGSGQMPQPFDFRFVQSTFESTGGNMRDLYVLAGVSLPQTGAYHLGGRFARREERVELTDMSATAGHSDMHGTVLIDTKTDAPSHVEADLRSQLLRLSDVGAEAAGRGLKPVSDQRPMLPDTPFQLQGARRSDALVHFHADALEVGRVLLRAVAARVTLQKALITAAPVSASVAGGKITGAVSIDVSHNVPAVHVDLRVANLKLERSDGRKKTQQDFAGDAPDSAAPLEGPVQARIALEGHGNSIHELASRANGKVTAVLPHGALRSSLAELAGLDLRGLGLMATGSKADTAIRCAVASFDVQAGTMTAQRLLVDTEPVLISGQGTLNLDSEALDLQLQSRPKHPRLRLRAPLLVRGTLRHPAFSIDAKKSATQAGEALALGVLLTPLAAMLAFVDPGLAKDEDCGALLAQAQTSVAPTP